MSIGALSKATGIPANTLRTWERRYGFPVAERSAAGHREYPTQIVPHLVLVRIALSRGHRPSQTLVLSHAELEAMLDAGDQQPEDDRVQRRDTTAYTDGGEVEAMLAATRSLDANTLERAFANGFSRHGAVAFLQDHAHPFLVAVGRAWQAGELQLYHEHFASERLASFLATRWRAAEPPTGHRSIVLGTLPGEDHALGLHMVAVVATQAGWRPVFLGANTPPLDLARAARESKSELVAVSLSTHADAITSTRQVETLLEHLPAGVRLLIGGGGSVRVPDTLQPESLGQLHQWLTQTTD